MKATGVRWHADEKWLREVIDVRSSMCSPSQRMVVVSVLISEGGIEPCFYPVVAIRSRIVRMYAIRNPGDGWPKTSPLHREMIELGWRFQGTETLDDFLIITEEGLVTPDAGFVSSEEWEPVVCMWPKEEDTQRLWGTVGTCAKRLAARGEGELIKPEWLLEFPQCTKSIE